MTAVFEADFVDVSFGFRPKRGTHDALKALDHVIVKKKVSFVVDADVKGFFDNVDHTWLMKFLEHRIADTSLLRLIRRFF